MQNHDTPLRTLCRGVRGLRYALNMTAPADSLQEEDFYAWTQLQADLLRRLPPIGNSFDAENVAEEIEDL
jgi:Domain of unknown function DUF29